VTSRSRAPSTTTSSKDVHDRVRLRRSVIADALGNGIVATAVAGLVVGPYGPSSALSVANRAVRSTKSGRFGAFVLAALIFLVGRVDPAPAPGPDAGAIGLGGSRRCYRRGPSLSTGCWPRRAGPRRGLRPGRPSLARSVRAARVPAGRSRRPRGPPSCRSPGSTCSVRGPARISDGGLRSPFPPPGRPRRDPVADLLGSSSSRCSLRACWQARCVGLGAWAPLHAAGEGTAAAPDATGLG